MNDELYARGIRALEGIESHIKALEAQREALRKDAARYRYLRLHAVIKSKAFDARVDAAMKEKDK